MTCTFFGHRDAPTEIKPLLKNVILDLIENYDVTQFYLGNQGNFDTMARNLLYEIGQFQNIKYDIVLAYFQINKDPLLAEYNTILPEGIENVPYRFAIEYRNKWLIENSDIVITYVTHAFGGAAKFKKLSEKRRKTVIELSVK